MSLATLVLVAWSGFAPPVVAATLDCLAVEISAIGRGAHGATVMRHAAPHRLIRALDRLPAWEAATDALVGARIVALEAGPAINVIPPRAAARVELRLAAGATRDAVLRALADALGPEVAVATVPSACG